MEPREQPGRMAACSVGRCLRHQTGQFRAVRSFDIGESSSHEYSPVPLHEEFAHFLAHKSKGERGVQAAVGMEPGKVVARDSIDGREVAANDDFAVALHGDGFDGPIRA